MILIALWLASASVSPAPAAPGTQTFATVTIPAARAQIEAACGVKPEIAVEWDHFGNDTDGRNTFVNGGLGFLTDGFKGVCADASLKTEVKKQIKKIVLTQAYGAADPMVYLVEGALHVEYLWVKGEPGPDTVVIKNGISGALRGEVPGEP